jgi:hypothetical protein
MMHLVQSEANQPFRTALAVLTDCGLKDTI